MYATGIYDIPITAGKDMASVWSAAWTNAVVSFSHLLATLNSSLNFIIYCYKARLMLNMAFVVRWCLMGHFEKIFSHVAG